MKKFSFLMVLLLVFSLLAGCSSTPNAGPETGGDWRTTEDLVPITYITTEATADMLVRVKEDEMTLFFDNENQQAFATAAISEPLSDVQAAKESLFVLDVNVDGNDDLILMDNGMYRIFIYDFDTDSFIEQEPSTEKPIANVLSRG